MKSYTVTKLGESRGRPRIWIEGQRPAGGGFVPGKRFNASRDIARKMLILAIAHNGARVVSSKVKGEKQVPVIDINSGELLSVFDGMVAVRVVVQADRIFILPLASLLAAQERVSRMLRKMVEGDPILVGSMSHGGGVLSHALHSGLAAAGIDAKLAFANEIREDLLEQASRHNPAWDRNTVVLAAPMQELAFDEWAMKHLPTVEILEAGLPCSGASVAGRAKRSLALPEEHPEVGHLVVSFLMVIARVKPVVVLLENVKQYLTTGSMCILRNQLRDFGYELHETVLQAADWNELEHRDRMCLVAVTHGLAFDLNMIERPISRDRRIAEVLDSAVPADRWSPMLGLKAKQERDKAAGKSFAMQIVTPFDTKCPTITKGYAKVRSTDPKLRHPANPDLLRQFSPAEHARMKGIPEHLVFSLSATVAHELLGQSVCYAPFLAVGKAIGRALDGLLHQHRCSRGTSGPATEEHRAARHAAQKCGEELLGVLGVGTAVQRQ